MVQAAPRLTTFVDYYKTFADYEALGISEYWIADYAVSDLLPLAIVHRLKSGITVPVQLGFRKFWQRQARALLLSRSAAIAPYLNQSLSRDWR